MADIIDEENNQTLGGNTTDNVHVGLFHELLNSRLRLELEHGGKTYEMRPAQRVFVLGRNKDNDLVVSSTAVSRVHARFIFRNGKFILIDQSTNGTFVCPEGGREVCLMSEEEFPLAEEGKGVIGLASLTSSDGNPEQMVRYRCWEEE
jgi:hypothetical protein